MFISTVSSLKLSETRMKLNRFRLAALRDLVIKGLLFKTRGSKGLNSHVISHKGHEFDTLDWQRSFIEVETFVMVILSLPLIQEGASCLLLVQSAQINQSWPALERCG